MVREGYHKERRAQILVLLEENHLPSKQNVNVKIYREYCAFWSIVNHRRELTLCSKANTKHTRQQWITVQDNRTCIYHAEK